MKNDGMKIVDYTITHDSNRYELEKLVRELIVKGWFLSGGVAVDDAGWYQAMIKYDVKDD